MIFRWGRRGLVAAALAVTFVTPASVETTTSVHKADLHPSYKQVVRHVTPVTATPTTAGIHRAALHPSWKFEVRHVTPDGAITPVQIKQGGGGSGSSDKHVYTTEQLIRDDNDLLEIISVIAHRLLI